jgi:hypothetical protein
VYQWKAESMARTARFPRQFDEDFPGCTSAKVELFSEMVDMVNKDRKVNTDTSHELRKFNWFSNCGSQGLLTSRVGSLLTTDTGISPMIRRAAKDSYCETGA